jgi:hypothetical protein
MATVAFFLEFPPENETALLYKGDGSGYVCGLAISDLV